MINNRARNPLVFKQQDKPFPKIPVDITDSHLLADLKNQPIGSSCVTHILPFCGYFKGQEQIGFNPTSWHLVTYNFLLGHKL